MDVINQRIISTELNSSHLTLHPLTRDPSPLHPPPPCMPLLWVQHEASQLPQRS